jgi:hypothetical protein
MKSVLRPIVAIVGLVTPSVSGAEVKLGEETTVVFATVEQGREILSARDDFVRRLSPFDRQARLKTDRAVSEDEFLAFVAKSILPWSDEERQKVEAALALVQPKLRELSLPLPKEVLLILTTGEEEAGAAYTRANAVVLPRGKLSQSPQALGKLLCHELFHLLSRENAELREALYGMIGFVACDEIELPGDLGPRRITNPDAPRNDHCIRIEVDGRAEWAIPILYAKPAVYDVERGGEFFDYLRFEFLLVDRVDDSPDVQVKLVDGQSQLVGVGQLARFYEQVGRNTRYIIHPEEILADNFALLMLDERKVPSPEILDKLESVLTQQ